MRSRNPRVAHHRDQRTAREALSSLFGPDLNAGPILPYIPAQFSAKWVLQALTDHGVVSVPLRTELPVSTVRSAPTVEITGLRPAAVTLVEVAVVTDEGFQGMTVGLRSEADLVALKAAGADIP